MNTKRTCETCGYFREIWVGDLCYFTFRHSPSHLFSLFFHAFPMIGLVITLQGTNISRLGKGKTIFKNALVGDMLVPGGYRIRPSRSYGDHIMVASHPIKRSCILIAMIAALFLNKHAHQNSTIEVVHCRYQIYTFTFTFIHVHVCNRYVPGTQVTYFLGAVDLPFYTSNLSKYGAHFNTYVSPLKFPL